MQAAVSISLLWAEQWDELTHTAETSVEGK